MKNSIKIGFGFGLTSAIVTTVGLMTGLYSSTLSTLAVAGGIISIAVADAASDALGIHVSEEFKNKKEGKSVWESTISTFLSKFVFAIIFLIPLIFLQLKTAVIVNIIFGAFMLGIFSYKIAKDERVKPFGVISQHIFIMLAVVAITYLLGKSLSFLGF